MIYIRLSQQKKQIKWYVGFVLAVEHQQELRVGTFVMNHLPNK